MSEAFSYFFGLAIGIITGLYYFAGLWVTVKKIGRSKNPTRLLGLSYAVRLVPTLVIMYILIRKDPGMFVAMLIGFFAVRLVMSKKIAHDTNISSGKMANMP